MGYHTLITHTHHLSLGLSCHFVRFRPLAIKDVIHQVLKELLHEKQYSSEEAKALSKEISDSIQSRLKGDLLIVIQCFTSLFFLTGLELDRYKYIVQVVIGEQRGEGVK